MVDNDTPFSSSSLFCQEDASWLNAYQDKDVNLTPISVSEQSKDDEYIQICIQRETNNFVLHTNVSSSTDLSLKNHQSWFKCARLNVIKWILNKTTFFGFQFRTAYLAITYFDRYFTRRCSEDGKLLGLLMSSVACLSLAAKIEEINVPALSEYEIDGQIFQSNSIKKMELHVLATLEWRMVSITPFSYLHYFVTKFCGDSDQQELVSKAVEFVLGVTKEINLTQHRPSVIAGAAVLAACSGQLRRNSMESKINAITSWGSSERECVFSCYRLMQEMYMAKFNASESPISPNSLVTLSTHSDVLKHPLITSGIRTRRRLTYNARDLHCPVKKIRRE